jgi:hypothetical protein
MIVWSCDLQLVDVFHGGPVTLEGGVRDDVVHTTTRNPGYVVVGFL